MNSASNESGVSRSAIRLTLRNIRKRDALHRIRMQLMKVALGQTVGEITFPCRFKASGCQKQLLRSEVAKHERHCRFQTYGCPIEKGCLWRGTMENIVNHLKDAHRVKSKECRITEWSMKRGSIIHYNNWAAVMICYGRQFLVWIRRKTLDTGDHQMKVSVILIEKDNRKYVFRGTVESKEQILRWEGSPASVFGDHTGFRFALNYDLGIDDQIMNDDFIITVELGKIL